MLRNVWTLLLQGIALILYLLGLAGALLFVGPLYVFYVVEGSASHWVLRRRMRRQGRLMTRAQLNEHASSRRGTLILEGGKWIDRIWWTPETILDQGPRPIHIERPPLQLQYATETYINWCMKGCINRRSGDAFLADVHPIRVEEIADQLWKDRTSLCETITLHGVMGMEEHVPGNCHHCGYSLAGLESDLCPECGKDPRDTFRPSSEFEL